MQNSHRPFRKARQGFVITESYCPVCGMFIAASPRPQLLALAERLHRCGPRGRALDDRSYSPQAHIVAYAFGMQQRKTGLFWQHQLAPLMSKLARRGPAFNQWLHHSKTNAKWFRRDPIAALRAANLGIEEKVLKELDSVSSAIARQLRTSL